MSSDLKVRSAREKAPESLMQKNTKKAQILQQKREADANITALIDKFIASEAELGTEHYKTQMLKTFLELIVPLKELSDLIIDMQEAFSTLSETLSLIDETLGFITELMVISPKSRYGIFRRLKERYRIRRFIRNHAARMKSISAVTSGMAGISNELRVQLEKMSIKMTKNNLKQQQKTAKLRAGNQTKMSNTDNTTAGYFINTSAEKLILDRKKQQNIPVAKSSSVDGKPSASSDDISDVDDIVGGR